MPADLYVGLEGIQFHAEVLLGSTAAAIVVWLVFELRLPKAFQASSRFFNLWDNISAWPTFFFILLAVILKITAFIFKSLPD